MNGWQAAERLTREFGVLCIWRDEQLHVHTYPLRLPPDEELALRERIGRRRDALMAGDSTTGNEQDVLTR